MPMMPMYQNPLWLKSVQARMRGVHLMSWGVVTLSVTVFVSLLIYFIQTKQFEMSSQDGAKAVIPAILIIQAVLLMFFGTGAVAYGISQERDEGLVDYQRMTPMSPSQKVLGYLFGLPAREYALVGLTMPFLIVAVVMSGFSVMTLLHFYLVFFMSVWVYHMTGLTAGMVSPMPRMAAMVSMVMVAVLYFALPNLSRIGLPFFEHLTIRPLLLGLVWDELPASWQPIAEQSGIDSARPIPWFGGHINQTVYALLAQGFVIGAMFSVVRRKWVRENSHLFSKVGGLFVFGGVLLFLLSSLSAIITQDEVYRGLFGPRFEGNQIVRTNDGLYRMSSNPADFPVDRQPKLLMVLLMISTALMASMYLLMTSWITAGRHTALEGWRRVKNRGRRGLSFNSDAASSLPVCLVMLAITLGAGWFIMSEATALKEFFIEGPTWDMTLLMVVSILGAGLFVQGACEWLSGRVFGVVVFVMWMIPLFTAVIMMAAFDMFEAGLLIAMPCPPVMMFSALSQMLDSAITSPGVSTELVLPSEYFPRNASITRIGVYGYLAVGVGAQLMRWRHRAKIRRVATSEGAGAVTRLASGPAEAIGEAIA